ncbi:hypothetical protein [Leptothoe kymatousa]|uniref:Uncharacterized protein n=1 Tax=Leptothoe kymatousa TAU-MAC 1615 TaxID=2364775 RepID=A0ABS5Y3M1_9CYAN|nr:hypothetical protein [Leptothoe kymatousa]MBT9312103.1 hypothetical protein [Leptothoe kymatousa TAU-MAC 1615]
MASPDSDPGPIEALYIKFLSADTGWINPLYIRLLGGLVVGGLLVSIPLFYAGIESVDQLSSLQLCLILLVMQVCILLAAKLGDRFVDAIAKTLDNLSL